MAAPETGNDAASSGSFVPLLTIGIPGSGTIAAMLGALVAYGNEPGPRMFVESHDENYAFDAVGAFNDQFAQKENGP